jgi:hypothetical protein
VYLNKLADLPMKNILILIAAATLFTGCATTASKMPLDSKVAAGMSNKTVALTTSLKKPDFPVLTPTRAALGLFGVAAQISGGNAIINDSNVDDPAVAIAGDLAAILEGEYGSQTIAAPLQVADNNAGTLVAAARASAQYALDVRSGWNMMYFPTDWTHYRLLYVATARLVDTSTQAVLAEGSCKYFPETNVGAPTYDEMVGNNAAGLKRELSAATRACFVSLKADMFAL